jgi:formamidase
MGREHEVTFDPTTRLRDAPNVGHNRWHESIPPILEIVPGDSVTMDVRDGFDGQITPGMAGGDMAMVSLAANHPLTGPILVKGAQPGDLLQVDILDIEPRPSRRNGFTAILPGFGLLRERFPEPYLVHWRLAEDGWAESEQIPGVRIPGAPFCGIIGVAPDPALRLEITERETRLGRTGATVALPEATEAIPDDDRIAREGLRTIPPRENGGNLDVKLLRAGATAFLPVFVEGALFSVGDLHYAQGDGEVCGSAIEMAGRVRLRLDLHKGEAGRKGVRGLQLITSPRQHALGLQPRRFIVTSGICVEKGVNYSEDITVAARRAVESMIAELGTRGLRSEQAYVLCSVAADLAISQAVDLPNVLVTAMLPLDIFTD